jgi:hypothetical protein
MTIHRQLPSLLLVAIVLVPVLASTVTEEDFEAKTTLNLLNRCWVVICPPSRASFKSRLFGYSIGGVFAVEARFCEHLSFSSANAFCLTSLNVNCAWHDSKAPTRPSSSTSGRSEAQLFSFWKKHCSFVRATCHYLAELNPATLNVWTDH